MQRRPFAHLLASASNATLVVLGALAALASAGCSGSSPAQDQVLVEASSELHSAQHLSRTAELTCEAADCIDGVGMFLHIETAQKKVETSQCPLTLVAPDLVMTELRCVPLKRRVAGASLKTRAWAVFPKTAKAAAENIEADQVVSLSVAADAQFVFVHLSKASQHPVARLSPAGFAEDLELKIVKISAASDDNLNGEMVTDTCRVGQGASATSPTAKLEDCELTAADSGAPLFDATGAVRALSRAEPGQSTNLACVSAPQGLLGAHPPCVADTETPTDDSDNHHS